MKYLLPVEYIYIGHQIDARDVIHHIFPNIDVNIIETDYTISSKTSIKEKINEKPFTTPGASD